MTLDWTAILNGGFLFFFGVSVIYFLVKHGPTFLAAWNEFTHALDDLATSVSQNSAITQKHYDETVTVKDELKGLSNRLDAHDKNALNIKNDQAEILRLLREIERKITDAEP